MAAKIVAGFPGVGKSMATKHKNGNFKYFCKDSDSSEFHWDYIDDKSGNRVKKLSPFWPDNYIRHLQRFAAHGMYDFIFVSSHAEIRDALHKAGMEFTLVYPDRSLKDDWIRRVAYRPDNGCDVDLLTSKWDEWIDEMEAEPGPKIVLQAGENLEDVLDKII